MSRKRRRKPGPGASAATATAAANPDTGTRMEAFSFGEPVPVLDRREILDYVESWYNGRWYEPPINPHGLSKSFRASPHHSSAIYVKRNILASTFIPHRMLSRAAFSRWALEYLIFGNGYLERRDNLARQPLHLQPALAKYVRRGQGEQYFFVQGWQEEHQFPEGSIFHLAEPDINQEIYGVPEYLSALQAAYLNESATLFRRKYYLNGSHAGFILYVSDPAQQKEDIDNMREALKQSKGPGNFRNLFLYSPDGKKDGIQVIPISEVAARDEFLHIKDASRDDVLAAHRVPPQLMGIIPKNKAGFGDVEKATRVFNENELKPLQARFAELNEWIGEEVIQFQPYQVDVGPEPSPQPA
ncbi:phage portal protein [Microbulbifer discodermiae]|uniref:phage portal protein n=1 Tax=Microbulbifer sp. 2201CG32-9 TaxID=3232309 RepID=UPI00345B5EF6